MSLGIDHGGLGHPVLFKGYKEKSCFLKGSSVSPVLPTWLVGYCLENNQTSGRQTLI